MDSPHLPHWTSLVHSAPNARASRIASTLAVLMVGIATACASAGDRLEQGMEAEAYGRYYQASMRYVEALEKDAQLTEARARLMEAGDSAIQDGLRNAHQRLDTQDEVGAGEEYQRLDRLLARARSVGVRLPTPQDYADARRATFDAAISRLMSAGSEAAENGRWATGRQAFARLRNNFDPTEDQRRESLDAESGLLLDWALAEESAGRFRRAFTLAGEALQIAGGAPAAIADAATRLQDRAVQAGTLGMAVFPVTIASDLETPGETDPGQLLADILELDHWRAPPRFIAVADPVLVRAATRRLTPVGAPFRPERILDEVGAHFGVLVEITSATWSEKDVRHRARTARTERGATARYTEEEGTLEYRVQADVLILSRDGRELDAFPVMDTEDGPFRRGIYDGDPRYLELSRAEARLFDPVVQGQQRRAIEDALTTTLAQEIAEEVFQRVLSRIR